MVRQVTVTGPRGLDRDTATQLALMATDASVDTDKGEALVSDELDSDVECTSEEPELKKRAFTIALWIPHDDQSDDSDIIEVLTKHLKEGFKRDEEEFGSEPWPDRFEIEAR